MISRRNRKRIVSPACLLPAVFDEVSEWRRFSARIAQFSIAIETPGGQGAIGAERQTSEPWPADALTYRWFGPGNPTKKS
jgi:hypothetical protein